jgi:SAM-dependent methyltransferase
MFVDEELNKQYIKLIEQMKESGDVLDMGCGTGLLSILLAQEGYQVTATDLSEQMLEVAYNNMIEAGVHINFFVQNILDTVNRDYDIITLSSDVINYMQKKKDVSKVFENVSLAMNKDSIFVFDFLRYDYIMKLNGHHEEILLPDNLFIWDVVCTNIDGQIKHTVKIGDQEEIHYERAFLPKEYTKLLHKNGLKVVKKVKNEDRYIYICKKEI